MKEIRIDEIESTPYLRQWKATRDGKVYDIIFDQYSMYVTDMPVPKDTFAAFIRDSECTLSVITSAMALEFEEEDRKRLFNNYIDTFETVKSKTPRQ
jgi:hypothetical protein